MKYEVHLTPAADEQIYQQYRHIAVEQQSPQNADEWWDRIDEAVDSLDQFPNRCPLAEENDYKDYEVRKLGIDGFNLLYTVFEDRYETWVLGTRGRGMEVDHERLPDNVQATIDELDRAQSQQSQEPESQQGQDIE